MKTDCSCMEISRLYKSDSMKRLEVAKYYPMCCTVLHMQDIMCGHKQFISVHPFLKGLSFQTLHKGNLN